MTTIEQGKLYRSRDGIFLGVCRGIADAFDFNVFPVRLAFVIVSIFSGFWLVIGVYLVAAFFMKPEPIKPVTSEEEQMFYDSYINSPRGAVHQIKRKFAELERRIQKIENEVTSKEYDWERRFHL